MASDNGIHTKLFGGRRVACPLRNRLTAKPISVITIAIQKTCDKPNHPNRGWKRLLTTQPQSLEHGQQSE